MSKTDKLKKSDPKTGKTAAAETGRDDLSMLAELAGEMVEAGQAAALGVFEAEVDELKELAHRRTHEGAASQEARRREEETEAEDGFDNMPV